MLQGSLDGLETTAAHTLARLKALDLPVELGRQGRIAEEGGLVGQSLVGGAQLPSEILLQRTGETGLGLLGRRLGGGFLFARNAVVVRLMGHASGSVQIPL